MNDGGAKETESNNMLRDSIKAGIASERAFTKSIQPVTMPSNHFNNSWNEHNCNWICCYKRKFGHVKPTADAVIGFVVVHFNFFGIFLYLESSFISIKVALTRKQCWHQSSINESHVNTMFLAPNSIDWTILRRSSAEVRTVISAAANQYIYMHKMQSWSLLLCESNNALNSIERKHRTQ